MNRRKVSFSKEEDNHTVTYTAWYVEAPEGIAEFVVREPTKKWNYHLVLGTSLHMRSGEGEKFYPDCKLVEGGCYIYNSHMSIFDTMIFQAHYLPTRNDEVIYKHLEDALTKHIESQKDSFNYEI